MVNYVRWPEGGGEGEGEVNQHLTDFLTNYEIDLILGSYVAGYQMFSIQ